MRENVAYVSNLYVSYFGRLRDDDGALCFNLPTPPERDQGNPEYAGKLQAVARRLGLPEDYVVGIH